MKKIILSVTMLAIAASTVFVACNKGEEVKSKETVSGTTKNLQKVDSVMLPPSATIESIVPIPMTDVGLTGCLSCYDNWISTWLSSLSPEALKVVFDDYPFLKGYVIKFGQKVNGYDVSILITHNTQTGEDLSLIRKTKGTVDENNKLTGEYVLAEMNGTEILHNTYVAGVRTNEINNLDNWVENPSVWPCARPANDSYFGHCTRAQFNAAYQHAKSECEADWQCDFLCSFHPCAVSYLASAMIDCW